MTTRIGFSAAAALWAGAAATGAHAVKPCVPADEAAGLMLFLAPEAIKAVGIACTTTLPTTALVRQTTGPFIEKYQSEGRAAWPRAKNAIAKMSGDGAVPDGLMDNDLMQPMISAMLVPIITKDIKTKDCTKINRIVTLLEPLPPRNAAELVVTISEAGKQNSKFPICPAAS